MEYRYTLGRKSNGIQLVPDNNFSTGCGAGNWQCIPGTTGAWTLPGGNIADYNSTGGLGSSESYLVSNNFAFQVGKRYKIKINILIQDPNVYLKIYVGNYNTQDHSTLCNVSSFEFESLCISGSDFLIAASCSVAGSITIRSVEIYEMVWNAPLKDQPQNNTKKSFTKSEIVRGVYLTYLEKVEFFGDGYTYLRNQENIDFTNNIPILVEYFYKNSWNAYFQGIIYLNEVEFNNNVAICSIEDEAISKILNKKIECKYYIYSNDLRAIPQDLNPSEMVYIHNRNTGNYDGAAPNVLYNIFRTLRRLIHEVSNLDVNLESDFFGATGNYGLAIAKGWNLNVLTTPPGAGQDAGLQISIKEILKNLDALYCIGIIGKIVNGVPTIKLERFIDIRDSVNVFKIKKANNLHYVYNNENNYADFQTGFTINWDTVYNKLEDGTTHYISTDKIAEGNYDASCQWIQDTQLIAKMVNSAAISGEQMLEDIYLIAYYKEIAFPFQAKSYRWIDLYPGATTPIPGWNYDPYQEPEQNFLRWLDVLNLTYKENTGNKTFKPTGKLLKRVFDFEYPLTFDEIEVISSNPLTKFEIDGIENISESYLEEIEIDNTNQIAKFKLISE